MCGNTGLAEELLAFKNELSTLDSVSTHNLYPSRVELSSKYALFKVQQPTGTTLVVAGQAQVTRAETTLKEFYSTEF
jgi:hypothetical protein